MIRAIVLSGGSGSRMNSKVKKQYMMLQGKPLIYYSLHTFCESEVDEVILVASEEDMDYCRTEVIEKYNLSKVVAIAPSGAERYLSVFSGLKCAESSDIVLIHDGARPFVTTDMIHRSIISARKHKACVVAMPVKDTIKVVGDSIDSVSISDSEPDLSSASASSDGSDKIVVSTPDRNSLWLMQTPQTFDYSLLMDCYNKVMSGNQEGITDDAMIVERGSDTKIHLIEGSYRNIKVTTPEDMLIAEAFLRIGDNS